MSDIKPTETAVSSIDVIIEVYKRDVDRTLIRENLKLSVAERMERFEQVMRGIYELQEAGQRMREKQAVTKTG